MTELEKLKQQKREIEKRIKELTCPAYTDDAGLVHLFANQRRGEPTGRWSVTVKENSIWEKRVQNKLIITADSKEDALECIASLVYSLTTVYHTAKGEHWDREKGEWV